MYLLFTKRALIIIHCGNQGDITRKTSLMSRNIGEMDLHVCKYTVKQIVKSQKNKINTSCCTMSLTFLIVSYCFLYNNITSHFDAWLEKNIVVQQDLHLCQYSSPKKCPDMNLSVTVAITITTWFKKCLSSKLSKADDEKSAFSIFIMGLLHFLHSIINITFACMHTHRNVIKCFYLVPLLFQESTFLELFPKRTNEGKVLLVFAMTIHTHFPWLVWWKV